MSGISQWILAVCIAAVAGGVLRMLLPPGSMARTMRWVICVFTISCLLLPLLQSDSWEIDWSMEKLESEPPAALSDAVQEQTALLAERRLMEQAKRSVEACGTKMAKFRLITDSDGESGIHITQVEVVLQGADRPTIEKVRTRLEELFGLPADVSSE